MRTGAERLRAGLLGSAALIAAVVLGFLLVARWRTHRLLGNLPAKLGIEIQRETNGFTASKSIGGRTVFTIHAVTATQRKDGRALLHEVGIVLYGKDGRADRIHGKDFEYDQKTGVVRAEGQVELDLQAPAPATPKERAAYAKGAPSADMAQAGGQATAGDHEPVHVVTSGLVYVQKLGVASTDQPLAFRFRGVRGEAVGAAYNTDSGMTVLEREVHMSLVEAGRPAELTAAHAELDQQKHRILLRGARYVTSAGGTGSERAAQRAVAAAEMEVLLAEDGDVQQAEGKGGVLITAGDARAQAPEGQLVMSDEGRPSRLMLRGGVMMARGGEDKAAAAEESHSSEAVVLFDNAGEASEVHLRGDVEVRHAGADGVEDRMRATEADLHFQGGAAAKGKGHGQTLLERVDATGGAHVLRAGGSAPTQEMGGDRLVALFGQGAGGRTELREITGEGHTLVRRVADGFEQTSRGATLEAHFAEEMGSRQGGAKDRKGKQVAVLSAMQGGGVELARVPVAGGAPKRATDGGSVDAGEVHGRAQELLYDGKTGQETLRGAAEVADEDGTMRAAQMVVTQLSGDTVATGDVLVSYRHAGQGQQATGAKLDEAEPVHVASARAEVRRAEGEAEFFGGPGMNGAARMWQGGSQIEAPVLLLHKAGGVLEAHGNGALPGAMPVRTVLGQSGVAEGDARANGGEKHGDAKSGAPTGQGTVLRVQSGALRFENDKHTADFTGGVRLEDGASTIESGSAKALLQSSGNAASSGSKAAEPGLPGGRVERVIATDDVVIRQPPGRRATGARAVYTTSDGVVVLTGTAGVPPRAEDPVNGAVTGASLRFRAGDNSVMVEGRSREGEQSTGDGKVHVQTRVRRP